jgi:hypothetical protein
MTIYKEKNMKKENLLEFKRMFELINHKKNNDKIDIKRALLKNKFNLLKEQDDFDFDFEEFQGEKEISDEGLVKSGSEPKYYANELFSKPAGSSRVFDMAFRMWILGISPGIIEQKIEEYNEKNPNEQITTFNSEDFKKQQKPSLGLLGIPGRLTEINKYSLEFLSRVYAENLNNFEKKFDKITKSFSSESSILFAEKMLESWLRTAVVNQVKASIKATFKDEVEERIFETAYEDSIKKIMELLKTKYIPTYANFNAFAVTVMRNNIINYLKKFTDIQIKDSDEFIRTLENLKYPFYVLTNAVYTKKIEEEIGKKIEEFTETDWNLIKEKSNSDFESAKLINYKEKNKYLGFKYNDPNILGSDIISANQKSFSGDEGISFSPVYYANILDKKLKQEIFKAVLSAGKVRTLKDSSEEDAILRGIGLETDSVDSKYSEYEKYGEEKEGLTKEETIDFFTSNNFLNNLFKIGKEKLDPKQFEDISSLFNRQKKEIFNKYPKAKKYFTKMLGEILYSAFIKENSSDKSADLKNENEKLKNIFLKELMNELTPEELDSLKTNISKDNITDLEGLNKLFTFNSTNIKGINDISNFIKKMDTQTKRKIFSELISEQKRKKAINKILLESKKTILKESFFQDVQNAASTLSQNTLFKNKYNNLSDSEKSKLLEKLISAFVGQTSAFSTFNFSLPINDLFLDILTYVITKKGIANSEIKNNCKKTIMLILYKNPGVLKKITQIGFGKAKVKYSEEIYNLRGQDIILDAINEKLDVIKDTDSFDPNKSTGKTWLFNIISNKVSDIAMREGSKMMSGAKSIDAPSTKSSKASDDTDDEFDSGVVSDDENLEYDVTIEPDFDFKISDKIKKVLQNISSQKGFNVENFIKNKYKNDGDFIYIKGDKKIALAKGNKNLSIKDAMMLLLLFIIGDGSEELYSKEGFHKTSKFIDYLVKDRSHKIVDLNTGEELPLDDLTDNDPESIRPNRVLLSRIVSDLQSGLKKKEEEMKAKGAIYENIRNFVEKYYIIKESKKKAIELEEERIANPDGQPKVDALENFIGSQVFGEDIGKIGQDTGWEDGMYGVFSYGKQFPIYLYTNEQFEDQDGNVRNKDGKYRWFHNIEEYKYDIDKDGEKEIMSSVEKHKKVLKPSAPTHGLTTATLVSLVNKFMRKNGIKDLSHVSISPGNGSGIHFGDSDHSHDGRKDRKNKR